MKRKKKDEDYIKRVNLRRFHRNVQKIKNKINARTIQRFIKVKLRKYFDKRKLIVKGIDEFNLYLKKKCLNYIKDKAKNNFIKKVLINSLKKQEKNDKISLLNYLNRWRNIIPVIEKNEAATKLQNLFRNFKSRQILNNLEKREEKLINIHKNYENKNNQIIRSNLKKWLNKAILLKNKNNANIISRYIIRKMLLYKIKKAKLKLKKLFIKDTKIQLAKIMERSSRIIGGKGEVVYKAIQDILYKNPFDKFIDNLKFKGKVNTLKEVQPKIHDAIKNYYLPKYLKKWKHKTYDLSVKYAKDIQKFLRIKYKKKVIIDKKKRKELLKKIIAKKHKNNLYKLQLPFSIWHKKTILAQANESAYIIQDNFRAYIARKHTQEALAKNKLKKLFKFNQLKNILNKIKEAGNKKILKTNRKIILNIIMKKKAYTDDKSALKRYFDKWRQYNKYTNNCVTKLANTFRSYKAKKERNRLKRINDILYKTVLKHSKTDKNTMRSKLRKWKNKSKKIGYDLNCRKIQRFMRPKLAKIRNTRFKKYFFENAEKKVKKLLLIAAKFNKIKKSLERPSLQRFSNNIKKMSLKNKQTEKLDKIINKRNVKLNKLLLKKYLLKWYNQINKINEIEDDSATMIQNAFRTYKARKFAKNKLFIKKVLKKNIIKKSKINSNQIYSFFKRWLNAVRNISLNKNALLIQMFCTQILFKINAQNELSRKIKVKNFLNKICNIKYGAKYALDKIKSKRDKEVFIHFNKTFKNKRLKILKRIFSKIKSRAFKNKLKSALTVPKKFHGRILKRIILKWNENANKLSSKQSAEMLQKNMRIYLNKKKQDNKKSILKHLLLKLIQKKSNIKYKYFTRMKVQSQKMTKEIQKNKLAKYIAERYKISKARKNWIYLAKKYSLRNRNDDIFTIINKIKQYIAINKMKNSFKYKARVSVIKSVKDNIRKNDIVTLLEKILPERNEQNNYDILDKYLKKWKLNSQKLKKRENKLKNGLKIIEKKDLKKNIKIANNVMLIKKIFNDIPKIRAKLFLNKLKKIRINKHRYEKLKKHLKNAKRDLLSQNEIEVLNRIYKIYAYQKINNMFNILNKNLIKKTKPFYGKEFLKKLYTNRHKKKQYKYGNQLKSIIKPKTIKLNFKKKIIPNKPTDITENKNGPMKKVLPKFVNYLERKILYRRKDIMERLQEAARHRKFVYILKKYVDKTIFEPKKETINMMHRDALYSESRPIYKMKLFKLFRKKFIQELAYSLEEPAKIYHLYYLTNVTIMHKRIARQRFYREMIRKWRFATFAKKMTKKKLELMYKNLHASYLQMADEFFGEDGGTPSVIQEFEKFGNNVGMFTGENPQVGEEINKRYYSNVEKKYIFANGQEDAQKVKKKVKKKISKKEKVEKVKKEIIPDENSFELRKKDPFLKYKKK